MKESVRSGRALKFGLFEADLAACELRKSGAKIRLQSQPFQVLALLLENVGQVVTREEIRQKLWPVDTFVDFDNGLNTAINKIREALGDSAENPRFIETLSRRGYRFLGDLNGSPGRTQSLLVLPLENLSGDPEQEFFADGLTEALITSLAKIGALRVLSRTTAMHYKSVRRPLPEIARELGVDAVAEGTVLRAGERVRISVQLVHAPTDTHLWAESYDRDLRDILALQSEVAQAVARQIQVKLTPLEQARFAQVHPVDLEAYEAYLKGRYHWNRRIGKELPKAAQCFQRAIEKDPSYAAAYAGLADSLSSLGTWSFVSPNESCGKAKGAALRAVELDPGLGEAHVSLAWVTAWYDYDFATAEGQFERAIELSPRYATGHYWFGFFLAYLGRYEEGYTELRRAIRLDPFSAVIHWGLGFVYWCWRRYDKALEELQRTIELDSNFAPAHAFLGWVYSLESLHELAITSLRTAVQLSRGSQWLGSLGRVYAAAGRREDALEILQQLNELSKQCYVTPYVLGQTYAALGDIDEAFRWLETGYQERAAWMVVLKIDPHLDPLRSDPRFEDLLRRMNFPDA
ncbi:MAG TPA: winged helix-turn-helix domain-containing protein [Candidatus Sulfotelmatobacter sp.]|nr:winged helix-turn-helix domain-containing protein [Candidatus Sulfotelmatobacter sp.]